MYPVFFQIFGFEFETYPFMLLIGVFVVSYVFSLLCIRKKLSLDLFTDHLYFFAISSFLSARIGGVLELSSLYASFPWRFFYFFDGAYNFYAAFLGFFLTFFFIVYMKKENVWRWLDVITPSCMGLFIFLSIAEFLSGRNYGTPSNLPWAVSFDLPEVRYTVPVHPVQLYEALGIILILLFSYLIKKKTYDGILAAYIFFGYFLLQIFLSFFRGTPDTLVLGVKLSLILSIIFASISLVVLIIQTHPKVSLVHDE